jgi:hypothetical protein
VKSTIAIIDTISLGTSLTTSYFYVWYRGEKSESIPWDASSSLMKEKIERMATVSGSVCVSRSKSTQLVGNNGFRWAIRFESIHDDLQLGFRTEQAEVFRNHQAIDLDVSLSAHENILSDWSLIDGDESMCTFRYAEYQKGSGANILLFRYVTLPGDVSSRLTLNGTPTIGIKVGIDSISNALNEGQSSALDCDLDWNGSLQRTLAINTKPPEVVDVLISGSTDLGQPLHAGDVLSFEVIFSMPIIVS